MFTPITPHTKERMDRFNACGVEWIICDMQPFHVVETDAFRNMIHDLDPRMRVPSQETMKSALATRYNELARQLRAAMEATMETCSITTDIWSSRSKRPFISLTVHWLSPMFELKSAVIGLEPFDHPHTAGATRKILSKFLLFLCPILSHSFLRLTVYFLCASRHSDEVGIVDLADGTQTCQHHIGQCQCYEKRWPVVPTGGESVYWHSPGALVWMYCTLPPAGNPFGPQELGQDQGAHRQMQGTCPRVQ